MLFLKSNSVLLSGKTISTDTHVLQKDLLFLFIHWFNEGCCVEWGNRQKGPFHGKGNRGNTFMKGMLTLTPLPPRRTIG